MGGAGQRAGLGPDRGVQPPGHCSIPHSSDNHREPALGQSLVMGVGGDPAPSPGEGECEDVRAGGAGQGLAALADIAEEVGWEDWALSVMATSSV